MEYILIRSRRRTVALEVKSDLTVVVRAPLKMQKKEIDAFLQKHEEWLAKALARSEKRAKKKIQTDLREKELREAAAAYLPKKTEEWAKTMGVRPTGVRITAAKTRFGSCSGKNAICYSWRLMAYPERAAEYVVVHELAHILQKNHSPAFYAIIERYLPDWRERRALLRE